MGAWADSGVLLLKLVASMAEIPSGGGIIKNCCSCAERA